MVARWGFRRDIFIFLKLFLWFGFLFWIWLLERCEYGILLFPWRAKLNLVLWFAWRDCKICAKIDFSVLISLRIKFSWRLNFARRWIGFRESPFWNKRLNSESFFRGHRRWFQYDGVFLCNLLLYTFPGSFESRRCWLRRRKQFHCCCFRDQLLLYACRRLERITSV